MHALLLASLTLLAAADAPPADLPVCPSADDKPAVAPLIRRTERVLEGRSSIAVMNMSIKTPAYERTVKMKVWSKGRDFALVRVLEGGPRETGMMTLKREKQLWNYLPQAGRVMKLPSGMMGDSWMGSDFTNDDLVKGSSIADDFTAVVDKTGAHDGHQAWFITLTPKPEARVVWGKIELILDRATRRMTYADLKKLGWRDVAMKITITPAEKGRQTTITYDSLELDGEVADDTFSLRRLQQGKE